MQIITSILDILINFYLILFIWVAITGGFTFQIGTLEISATRMSSPLKFLIPLIVIRWVFTKWKGIPSFVLNQKTSIVVMRLLEIGIFIRVILIPVVWIYGEYKSSLFSLHSLSESIWTIFVLIITRMLIGRNYNGILATGSLILAMTLMLFSLEIFLRVHDFQILAKHQKTIEAKSAGDHKKHSPADKSVAEEIDLGRNDNEKGWTWGHRVINNRFGFREKEFEVPKPENTYRIMVLGDSLTWGAGLAPEERYTDILDKMLKMAFQDRNIEVLNFAYSGSPTVTERDLLNRLQHIVDPDFVILGFCINDPQPRGQNYSVERARLDDIYNAIASLRHIGLKKAYSFLINRIDNIANKLGTIPTWQEALDRTYDKASREWKAFERALSDIKAITEERGIPAPLMILLIQGIAKDKHYDPFITKWFHQAREAGLKNGFIVVNPENTFLNEVFLRELPVNPKDGHPSAKCNQIYAKELYQAILPILKKTFTAF